MKYCLVVFVFFLGCESPDTFEPGFVEGRTYENRTYGIAVDFPENWSIIADFETMKLIGEAEAKKKEKWEQAKAKPLVVCYRFADAETDGASAINPNISVYTEYISPRSQIHSAKEYIPFYKDALNKHRSKSYRFIEDETAFVSTDLAFEILDMEYRVLEKDVRQKTFLFKYGNQMLNITLSWEKGDDATYLQLLESYRSIRLSQKKIGR